MGGGSEGWIKGEFQRPDWSGWRVISWIALRDAGRICEIKDRFSLAAFVIYTDEADKRSRSPDADLLDALKRGNLVAVENGAEIGAAAWLGRDDRSVDWGTAYFRRDDVLRLWPVQVNGTADAAPPVRRGPKSGKTNAVAARLVNDVRSGKQTIRKLKSAKQAPLAEEYGVSRDTMSKAIGLAETALGRDEIPTEKK